MLYRICVVLRARFALLLVSTNCLAIFHLTGNTTQKPPVTLWPESVRHLTSVDPSPKRKKTKKGPRIYPNIYSVLLDTEDQKTWEKFRELDEAVPALTEIVYPNDEEQKTSVNDDHIIVQFIGEFAVDAFNKSCQMYVNKNKDKNITEAKFRACKYHKTTTAYHFYMTIVAVEQGNRGVYETKVECNPVDGARTLGKFVLTDRKPFGASNGAKPTFETYKDGSPDLEDYNTSGMVRRKTKGGYDYHNPFGFERVWQL